MSDYGYLGDWPLSKCSHSTEWVQTRFTNMASLRGKGHPSPEFRTWFSSTYKILMPLNRRAVSKILIFVTTLHYMVGDAARAVFPHFIDVRYFATITWDRRFTFWVCNCLGRFKGVLKQVGVYEAIWAFRFKQPLDLNFLKVFIARWFPNTNIILTCFRELGFSLWDVFQNTGLPIVDEMYDEFFPNHKLIIGQSLPKSFRELFYIWGRLFVGMSRPKFTKWVKELVHARLNVTSFGNLGSLVEDFEDWDMVTISTLTRRPIGYFSGLLA